MTPVGACFMALCATWGSYGFSISTLGRQQSHVPGFLRAARGMLISAEQASRFAKVAEDYSDSQPGCAFLRARRPAVYAGAD